MPFCCCEFPTVGLSEPVLLVVVVVAAAEGLCLGAVRPAGTPPTPPPPPLGLQLCCSASSLLRSGLSCSSSEPGFRAGEDDEEGVVSIAADTWTAG